LLQRIEADAERRSFATAVLAHAGSGVAFLRVSGALGESESLSFAEWLQAQVSAAGGWVVFDLFSPDLKGRIDPWGPEPPGMALMRGIKQALDPKGHLSPGRFVGGI
jgi:glycolate oxidase FAD binding subunit